MGVKQVSHAGELHCLLHHLMDVCPGHPVNKKIAHHPCVALCTLATFPQDEVAIQASIPEI